MKIIFRTTICFIGLFAIWIWFFWIQSNLFNKNNKIEIHNSYKVNFDNDNALVWASHNVFVWTVKNEVSTIQRWNKPETQYKVNALYNIKWELNQDVIVNQQAGYKDWVLYISESDNLISNWNTYLFATRYNKENDWYTIISHPKWKKLISEKNLAKQDLINISKSNLRIKELEIAYKNEILLDTDIKNNNTRNSYQMIK